MSGALTSFLVLNLSRFVLVHCATLDDVLVPARYHSCHINVPERDQNSSTVILRWQAAH
jgi:hypothetical protein